MWKRKLKDIQSQLCEIGCKNRLCVIFKYEFIGYLFMLRTETSVDRGKRARIRKKTVEYFSELKNRDVLRGLNAILS